MSQPAAAAPRFVECRRTGMAADLAPRKAPVAHSLTHVKMNPVCRNQALKVFTPATARLHPELRVVGHEPTVHTTPCHGQYK